MDFLNQATGQLRELMLSMTPAARVTALLLLGVIGVSLGYLVQHQSASPDSYLFNGEILSGSAISRAEAAIAKKGLEGYEIVGNRIKVPSGRKAEFLAAVAEGEALPPNFHNIFEKANDSSPFAAGDTRRHKIHGAREHQLSLMLEKMSGIEEANVVFDVVKARGLSRVGAATASVAILPTPGEPLNGRRMKMIKKAVAGAIAELKPNDVVVTNMGDGSMFDGGDEISSDSFDDPYFAKRLAYEKKMKSNIEYLLRDVPGARVQVTAELENTLEKTVQTLTPEGDPAEIRRNTQTEKDTITEVENGGQPGPIANSSTRNNKNEAAVTVKNNHEVESNQVENVAGQKNEFVRMAGLTPENVRVAVAVPSNYLLSVWKELERKKNKDPNQPLPDDIDTLLKTIQGTVTDNIKNAIVQLIPGELAENKLKDIEVVFFESLTPAPTEGPSTATQALGWASQNFNTMTMAAVALIGLMMLRSMVKSIPAAEPAAALASATLSLETGEGFPDQAANDEDTETQDGKRPRLRLKKGESLKDDLIDIVREDPDAAAAILRSWIGNAG